MNTSARRPSSRPLKKPTRISLSTRSNFLPRRQFFIHQHADGDGQRLRADVARHIQNEGLEADNQRNLRDDGLEQPDDGGNAHAEKEQDNQPRQALFEAGFQRLMQILLAGQAAQRRNRRPSRRPRPRRCRP